MTGAAIAAATMMAASIPIAFLLKRSYPSVNSLSMSD